ncbi:MAG: hypothetical protein QG618_2405, partial [Thermodesulfobacteriota bacterium]|nr:hypothetical protein [Thermodesulfobacteriota bacterium]
SVTYNGGLTPDTGIFQVEYEGYQTWGFCVDLGTALDLSQPTNYDYTTQKPVDYNTNLAYVEWLLDEYGQNAYATTNGKATRGAALQLAIWEVLYDFNNLDYDNDGAGTDSYDSIGNFYYNRSGVESTDNWVNNFYDEYINALTLAITGGLSASSYVSSGNYVVADLFVGSKSNKEVQDIIVNVVPEPTTALLLGFGLLGLCAVGRKRA